MGTFWETFIKFNKISYPSTSNFTVFYVNSNFTLNKNFQGVLTSTLNDAQPYYTKVFGELIPQNLVHMTPLLHHTYYRESILPFTVML